MRVWPRAGPGRVLLAATVVAPFLLAACDTTESGVRFDFERMIRQERVDPYEPSDLFPDGKAMRSPPPGVVPHETGEAAPRSVRTGHRDGEWLEELPVALSMGRIERGRKLYDIYCAPCHGLDGNAMTPVAGAMSLQRPPSLHADRVRDHPDGRLYAIVRRGFGLMPGYEVQLPVEDRWAVVAYVRALQLSQDLRLEMLPDGLRDRILERMPDAESGGGEGGSDGTAEGGPGPDEEEP